jgi:hypothetical protein
MHTLEEIYQKLSVMEGEIDAIQQKMGITTTTSSGITTTTSSSIPPRFLDNGNGTVTDTRTTLVWLKNANPCGTKYLGDADYYCNTLASGTAGLTDGSVPGQWRMPTKYELEGIGTDPPTTWESGGPTVTWTTPGVPFTNVQASFYFSRTECDLGSQPDFCTLSMVNGHLDFAGSNNHYVWPVRAGQ